MQEAFRRKYPMGAEMAPHGGVSFRVWAPSRKSVDVSLHSESESPTIIPMDREQNGYFSVTVTNAAAGDRYRYRLDDGQAFPDPASRFQPFGAHGPSQVVDPSLFPWTDDSWTGVSLEGQVIYELHVGTFTPEGTLTSAAQRIPELADLGITIIELMPLAEFPGTFGWGYDGVALFAPTRIYGEPDDLRRFVDKAHAHGLGVILDVVYNHLGPDGNYLGQYTPHYFTDRHKTPWGQAINYDGELAEGVRELFACNASYWIDEFHLDGLRLDSTQDIFDDSPEHILSLISRRARASAGDRSIILVAENDSQDVRLVRSIQQGGYGLDGLWNDDFHHAAMVAVTGKSQGYYSDFFGSPQELVSCLKWGFLFQGQRSKWQKRRRGTPTFGVRPATFITYIQNHDQIANSPRGLRIHELTDPGRYRAITALTLLGPGVPLLFQGQEFAASSPFLFFADHKRELAGPVYRGRKAFLSQFDDLATAEGQSLISDPSDPETFEKCVLDVSERTKHHESYKLHKDLLALRKKEPAFRSQRVGGVDGAVLGEEAFVVRFFGEDGRDLLLIVNLGRYLLLDPAPEPLLAPLEGMEWRVLWSSDHPDYGGAGTAPVEESDIWRIPGHCAVALCPKST